MDWPFMRAVPESTRQLITSSMRVCRFAADEVLFRQDDPGHEMYLISTGRVSVEVRTASGDLEHLTTLEAGEPVGEMALLGEPVRSATCVALEPTETLALHRGQLAILREADPAVDRFLVEVLTGRIKRLSAQVEVAERLRAVSEMSNTLLTAVSHEFRTPLALVKGFSATLARPDIDLGRVAELAPRLLHAAGRLEALLGDLIDVDKLSRGTIELNRRHVDVGAVASGVAEGLERAIDVRTQEAPAFVDVSRVERIVETLLANAVRHTPPDTPIWLSVRPDDGGVLICVDDAGPGVPDELRTDIFQAFRHGADVSAHQPGLGLGLALVAKLSGLHGGRAWVTDREGGGASFRVWLPAQPDGAAIDAPQWPQNREDGSTISEQDEQDSTASPHPAQ